jgi:hypothetical protein
MAGTSGLNAVIRCVIIRLSRAAALYAVGSLYFQLSVLQEAPGTVQRQIVTLKYKQICDSNCKLLSAGLTNGVPATILTCPEKASESYPHLLTDNSYSLESQGIHWRSTETFTISFQIFISSPFIIIFPYHSMLSKNYGSINVVK